MSDRAFDLQPSLANEFLRLRPLVAEDFEALYRVASDPLIWEQHPSNDRWQRPVFERFFEEAMRSRGAFAVIDLQTGNVIGSTRFQPVPESTNAIEIGWTFLGRAYWGGKYNLAMKSLMLDHAYGFVDNVLFYIGGTNWRSQRAVQKLGAKPVTELDGQTLDPRVATACIFRLTKQEWQNRKGKPTNA